jgi:uncharacterized protein YndB with AHSA1/START domain
MAAVPETGYLLVADLTGYTAYLSGAEIEHAPTIAGDLLETIVGRLEPPFRLAKFEGDAAFLFVEDGRAEPGLLLDAIEASYLAFRRRLRSIEQATACECAACRTAPRLDLKFFLHHGQYVRTSIAGRDELAGSSVIAVHRLLKGTTAANAHDAADRANGFVVYTAAAIDALGLDPEAVGLAAGHEAIEHLGEIVTYVQDLEARWQHEAAMPRLRLGEADLLLEATVTFAADASTVWNHLTSPALRARWEGAIVLDETPAGGRMGVGTTLQCVTGRLATIEEIVDWQPFEHVGYRVVVPEVGLIQAAYDLEEASGETVVRHRWSADGPIDRAGAISAAAARQTALDRLVGALVPSRETVIAEQV